MRAAPVFIRSVGLTCPVGLSWLPACAAMMAGVSRRAELEYCDNWGEPIIGSRLSVIDPVATVTERWLFLLARALQDAIARADAGRLEDLPIIVALPPDVRTGAAPQPAFVADELAKRLEGVRLDPRRVKVICEGAYGGYAALSLARNQIASGQLDACVVAGADSLVGAHALLRLSEKRRLLVQENSDGVTPGEAAAALVLSSRKKGALAAVLGLGAGHEASSLENDVPMRGDGISAAARAALAEAGLAFHDMDFRISDVAGETFFFKEQVLLVSKLLRTQKEDFPLWLAAEAIGDTGAAAGVCGLSYALGAFSRGRAPGRRVIAFAGNEQGQRGALVMEDMTPRAASPGRRV